jgi:hypothetical protein
VSSPWNERKRGGGREEPNPPNEANLPGRRADRPKKQSVVSSNPASVGTREDDGARNQRGGEREGACLPIGGGGSSGCGFALSFPHACFRRFFFILFWTDEWVETEARRVPPCRLDAAV